MSSWPPPQPHQPPPPAAQPPPPTWRQPPAPIYLAPPRPRTNRAPWVLLGLIVVVGAVVLFLASQPTIGDAADAARAEGCRDVIEGPRRVVVVAPLAGDDCARGAGAAAGTLGFTGDEVADAFQGRTVYTSRHSMTTEAEGLSIVITFTER